MTTWTMDQVRQAMGLRAEAAVSRELWDRAMFATMRATREQLANAMIQMAHPFVIDVHPGDLQFEEEPDRFDIKVRAWWEPSTRVIEFRGGAKDGEVMEVRDAGPSGVIRIPRLRSVNWSAPKDEPVSLVDQIDTYRCVGWREDERRWVYAQD